MIIRNLGTQDYLKTWQQMIDFTEKRTEKTKDELWLLEHPAVFTEGDAECNQHLLQATDIPVVKTDRGGQITYHGPGQLIIYLLLDIKRHHLGIRQLVSTIELSLINYLNQLNIKAQTKADAPGVYINEAKIASLGLRIRRGCCYHGLALNVDMDLTPFSLINPCGIANQKMTQLVDHHADINLDQVKIDLSRQLTTQLEESQCQTKQQ